MVTRARVLLAATLGAVGVAVAGWAVDTTLPHLVDQLKDDPAPGPDLRAIVLWDDSFDAGSLSNLHTGHFMWDANADTVPRPAAYAEDDGAPSYTDYAEAHKLGAVDAETTLFRVQLSSGSGARVNVNKVDLRVSEESSPMRGLWVDLGDRGGDVSVRYLRVNLDNETIEWSDEAGEPVGAQPFYVEKGETESIDVLARAQAGFYEWNLEVAYTTEDGKQGRLSIAPKGTEVFRTSSPQNAALFSLGNSCLESKVPGPRLCGNWPTAPGYEQPEWAQSP